MPAHRRPASSCSSTTPRYSSILALRPPTHRCASVAAYRSFSWRPSAMLDSLRIDNQGLISWAPSPLKSGARCWSLFTFFRTRTSGSTGHPASSPARATAFQEGAHGARNTDPFRAAAGLHHRRHAATTLCWMSTQPPFARLCEGLSDPEGEHDMDEPMPPRALFRALRNFDFYATSASNCACRTQRATLPAEVFYLPGLLLLGLSSCSSRLPDGGPAF